MPASKTLTITRIIYLRGPNSWTYRPVIEAWVDIGDLEQFPSNTLPGLTERLTSWLPRLVEHRCGVGERGGFVQRLHEGTWAAHILEHIVLELQNLAGMPTGFGQTRKCAEPSLYKMAFRTREEQVGREALEIGRELLLAAIDNTPFDMAAKVRHLSDRVDALCLGPSTAHILEAATKRAIPWIRLNEGNLVQLGFGNQQRRIWTAETDQTSAIAEYIATDKDLTKSLLKSCGIPVPNGCVVQSAEEAWQAAQEIGLPIAIKPYNANHGRGVSLNLSKQADVITAYLLAEKKGGSRAVIVEQFIAGNEHRVLVVGKNVVAVAAGETAWVTGNGQSSILELIDQQINSDPRRGATEEFPLNKLGAEHTEIILELKRQGFSIHDIPNLNQRVLIQRNGNVGLDVTDRIHPDIAAKASLAARVVGLDVAGVDMVVEDISKPLHAQSGAVVEVNAGPGLLAHIKPQGNTAPRPVGDAIISHLFPDHMFGRIPIVGITQARGTDAAKHSSTIIALLVAHLIQVSGKHVGLACATGTYLDQRHIDANGHGENATPIHESAFDPLSPGLSPASGREGRNESLRDFQNNDSVCWEAGQRLLMNRFIDAAVVETNHRMMMSTGLPYDRCAVGVVCDISDDMCDPDLEEFHVTTVDRLVNVIRTQIDVVLPDGVAVLNANNPRVVQLASLCDGKVIFYGDSPTLATIIQHRAQGERVVFLTDGAIVMAEGEAELASLSLPSAKSTLFAQVSNVMAAVAAAWALDISPDLIEAGLRTFKPPLQKARH